MPKFGNKSEKELSTCAEPLVEICRTAIQVYDFSVIYGYRNKEQQNELFENGMSKVIYPDSKHNIEPSRAVDLAPYPIDWKDIKRFYYLAGIIMSVAYLLDYKIRWGGDWDIDTDFNDQTFFDLGHFEIKT